MIGRWTVLNGVLVAIVVLLGVQITRTWMRTVPPLRVPVTASGGEPAARRDPKAKPPPARSSERGDEQVALITSMDLFDVSRQPVGTAGATVAVEVPPPTGIDVVGIRLLAGDDEAFIRDASQQNGQRRVREGDEVAGYTVRAINPTNVELDNPTGQTVTLWLQLAPSGGAKAVRPQTTAPRPPTAPASTSAGTVAARQGTVVAPPPLNPRAAERQRQRQQRIQRQRGGAASQPTLPAGVQQLRDQMRKGA